MELTEEQKDLILQHALEHVNDVVIDTDGNTIRCLTINEQHVEIPEEDITHFLILEGEYAGKHLVRSGTPHHFEWESAAFDFKVEEGYGDRIGIEITSWSCTFPATEDPPEWDEDELYHPGPDD